MPDGSSVCRKTSILEIRCRSLLRGFAPRNDLFFVQIETILSVFLSLRHG